MAQTWGGESHSQGTALVLSSTMRPSGSRAVRVSVLVAMAYVNEETLHNALLLLNGTADHMLKIWLTLKHMGLSVGSPPVEIDTSNSAPSLRRLFSFGAPDHNFFIPFSHTSRYATMKHDAARSIIQTNVRRWEDSQSVVGCNPTGYLDFRDSAGSKILVSCGRNYPLGLGFGPNGFARGEDARVSLPLQSFAIWYGRTTAIPNELEQSKASEFLVEQMLSDLNITPAEKALLFLPDSIQVGLSPHPIDERRLYEMCSTFMDESRRPQPQLAVAAEEFPHYTRRVRSMVSQLGKPEWLRPNPEDDLRALLDSGAKAILLYGPPRTGKTRFLDRLLPRASADRSTIQIHDGWSYDHLVEGLQPDINGQWSWHAGPLKQAIQANKRYIVLEEVNRTSITQALGEVFSLIEDAYRGELHSIKLRSGEDFFIPSDTIFIFTMNTIDKSTEDIDDALMGRMAAIEFPPNASSLLEMLGANGVPANLHGLLAELYADILQTYELGHGYFAGLGPDENHSSVLRYYKTRIRPVLHNFLGDLRQPDLDRIDNVVDSLFGGKIDLSSR